jgi:hypothetical protein
MHEGHIATLIEPQEPRKRKQQQSLDRHCSPSLLYAIIDYATFTPYATLFTPANIAIELNTD